MLCFWTLRDEPYSGDNSYEQVDKGAQNMNIK